MTYSPAQTLPLQSLGRDGQLVSRVALGCMGLSGGEKSSRITPSLRRHAIAAFEAALDAGITLFDHADLHGDGRCEELFRECLAAVPGSRQHIIIATGGGARADCYDLSAASVTSCAEHSLSRMGIDYIDLYQLHQPDPLTHPGETARALNDLVRRGLVRSVGVSNYHPEQMRALQHFLDVPLRSNQIQISLLCLDPLSEGHENGDGILDCCMAMAVTPLAWSPLAGGALLHAGMARIERVRAALLALAPPYDATPAQLALAWLLAHPSGILPVVGSTNPIHIREAAGAAKITLTREDWYRLWTAARGYDLPSTCVQLRRLHDHALGEKRLVRRDAARSRRWNSVDLPYNPSA